MLFRLSISGSIAEQWKKTINPTLTKIEQRRIYRWDSLWGILCKNTWTVENRTLLFESGPILLESVNSMSSIHAPPFHVDDVWDEEFYMIQNAEWNGILSICMPAIDILAWASKHSIRLPDQIRSYLQSVSVHVPVVETKQQEFIPQNPKGKLKSFVSAKHPVKKSRCLVMDD
jgi:hypothetical protein